MNAQTRALIRAALAADTALDDSERSALAGALAGTAARAWVSEAEAARLLGVSRAYLCCWRRGTRCPPGHPRLPFDVMTLPGTARNNLVRYDRAQVLAWARAHMTAAPAATIEEPAT